jgi:flagellin
MSTSINTNISALAAQSSLRKTGLAQDTAMERLSTGTRINNAKDDAAGLAITNRMTANIRGMAAAIRNANDGISLTQTAEGSMTVIGDNLQRIRELAVQSSNTGNSASDRAALNSEASQLISEIDRVATNSAFNGIKLLDGSFQNQSLQIGAGNEANDRISISIGSAKASALGLGGGAGVGAKLTGVAVGTTALASGSLAINGYMVTAAASDGVSAAYGDASGIAVANAINAISSQSGVSAQVSATKTNTVYKGFQPAVHTAGAFTAGSVTINGVDIGAVSAGTDSPPKARRLLQRLTLKVI